MKNYLLVLLTICFGYAYSYHVTSSQITPIADFDALKQQIISNAEAIVTTTHALSHQAKAIKNPAEFQQWINANEPVCPIALLSECTSTGCKLSRLDTHGHKRNSFDQLAAERLVDAQTAIGTANYVSFAAGGGFTDLRILTLAHEMGLKSVTIHLIDFSYASCINQLKSQKSHDIVSVLQSSSVYRAQSIKQFINYVTHLFGAGNVQLHLYGSGQEYLTTIKLLGAYGPDLIIGVDFDPSKKTYKTCIHDFTKIIENGSAQALHLHGNGIFHIAPKDLPIKLDLQHDPQKNRYSKKLISTALLFK
jgi:hypothetical protein